MVVIFDANRVVGAGQRNTRHGRGFHRQGAQIFRLQAMEIGLATSTGKELSFDGERVQEVIHPLGRLIRVKACAKPGSCVATPTGQRPVWQCSNTQALAPISSG